MMINTQYVTFCMVKASNLHNHLVMQEKYFKTEHGKKMINEFIEKIKAATTSPIQFGALFYDIVEQVPMIIDETQLTKRTKRIDRDKMKQETLQKILKEVKIEEIEEDMVLIEHCLYKACCYFDMFLDLLLYVAPEEIKQ